MKLYEDFFFNLPHITPLAVGLELNPYYNKGKRRCLEGTFWALYPPHEKLMKTKDMLQGKAQTLFLSWYPWMVFDSWWLTVISPASPPPPPPPPQSSDMPVVPCIDLGKISRSTHSPGLFAGSFKVAVSPLILLSDQQPQERPSSSSLRANSMDCPSRPALYSVIPATLRVMRNPLTSLSHSLVHTCTHTHTHSLTHIYTV